MVDTATAKYLSDNVGPVLAKAMAEMATAQPVDGVAYLSQWLKTYADLEEAKVWQAKEEKALAEKRAEVRQREAERETRLKEKQDEIDSVNKARDDLLAKFGDNTKEFVDKNFSEVVSAAQRITGAKSVYLGTFDEEGLDDGATGPCIRYDYTTPEAKWMEEKVLPKDTGVTYGALKENPAEEDYGKEPMYLWKSPSASTEPTEPPQEGEEPAAPALPPFAPVYIECVTDVEQMHYFHMTRLGSYLAVPMVFPSYYTTDALEDARKFEEEKKTAWDAYKVELAEAEAKKEEVEAATKEAEEKGEDPPEAVEMPKEPEEKELVLRGTSLQMVLCMDTLGTNQALSTEKIPELVELTKACGAAKAAYEMQMVDKQALFQMNEEERKRVTDLIEETSTEVATAIQEQFDEEKREVEASDLEEEPKKAKVELVEKKYAYIKARDTMLKLTDLVKQLQTWVVVTPEVLNTVAAAVLLYKYPKTRIYPKRKSTLTWEKLKLLIDDILFDQIKDEAVDGPRLGLEPQQKLAYIMSIAFPGEYDEEKATEVWPGFALLFNFVQAACTYRAADVAGRKEAHEQKAKEAEEGGDAASVPPLSEVDDDFVE